ncbi:MAG: imidazole glycerol phosphate synthase subunit HisH [Phycisphaerae bacterium]
MIAIVDYDMGNLRSVQKALLHVGADAQIVTRPEQIARAEKIVFPGQGAFKDAIARLRDHGLAEPVLEAFRAGKPFLGICLGLQLLFESSCEDGQHEGLGLLEGDVRKFEFNNDNGRKLSVPQIGWNAITWDRHSELMRGIEQGSYVYFCHSYYVAPTDASVTLLQAEYGHPYTAGIEKDNLFAVQFHPEKSQAVGLKMLENFVRL